MKYACFYFFRRGFWVQIGDRRRADIAAHPGSGCHHCTLHTAVSSLHIAHYTVIIVKCTVISVHCTLQCHHCKMHCHLCTLHTTQHTVITAHCTLHYHHCKMHCHLCTLQCHECILHTTLYCTVIFCELHSTLSSLQTAHRSPPHCHHCTSHCHRCTVHSHYIEHCKLHTAKGKLHLQLHLVWFDLECIENCTESFTGLLYQSI